MSMEKLTNPIDWQKIEREFNSAQPYRFFKIDDFLESGFAEEVFSAFPSFEQASSMGKTFSRVNEVGKIQVTDSSRFPAPIGRLNALLSGEEFLRTMSRVTGIPNLLADPKLDGGGIHETGPRGRLDVHIDFNLLLDRPWHRRLNILVYFNKDWKPEYGGQIEMWDRHVKKLAHAFLPSFNRCVVFETNEVSFHGVSDVRCPIGMSRKSFAAYYYTLEPPSGWNGRRHSTIFKARPDEVLKKHVLMPAERALTLLGGIGRRLGRIGRGRTE